MRRPLLLVVVAGTLALAACPPEAPRIVVGEGEGEGEGEGDAGEGEGEGEGEACDPAELGVLGPADKPRVVLVGHGNGPAAGSILTEVRGMTLTGSTLADDGVRLDVGVRPQRIAFVPSGAFALVLSDDGELVSVSVSSASVLAVVDTLQLPGSGHGDLRVVPDGTRAFVVNFDVSPEDTGVHEVLIGCDGALTLGSGFYSARLSSSLALLGADRAVLLGGQASFGTPDVNDVRIIALSPLAEQTVHDLFTENPDSTRIAASPDGTRAVIPDGSIITGAGGTVTLLDVSAGAVQLDRVSDLPAASEALFADAETVLVSRWDDDAVTVFDISGGTLAQTGEIAGVGLAEHMDVVTRGSAAGLVLVAATNAGGNIHLITAGAGAAASAGAVQLGAGFEEIPATLAIQP
jgi:DNA-binding beta-propeller fold protein YncE